MFKICDLVDYMRGYFSNDVYCDSLKCVCRCLRCVYIAIIIKPKSEIIKFIIISGDKSTVCFL